MLTCDACLIRPWERSDVPALAHYANNRQVSGWLRDSFPHPYTVEDAMAWISQASSAHEPVNFAIEVDGQAVGGIGFARGRDVHRHAAEIGYWLGQPFWGRGIATQALRRFCPHLFRDYHLLRLYAMPFVGNAASVRVLEKSGFQREGVMRGHVVKHGEVHDQAVYGLLNPDWRHEESGIRRYEET